MIAIAHDIAAIKTVEDFAVWVEMQEQRYEFIDGRIVLQAGTLLGHAIVQSNLIRFLGNRLSGKPCLVLGSDALINTKSNRRTGRFPDVSVRCGPNLPRTLRVLDDPLILIEITSPSTADIDRGEKLTEYRAMPSVMHYLVIEPDAVRVEHHAREGGGWTCRVVEDVAAKLVLDPPGVELPLGEVYAQVI